MMNGCSLAQRRCKKRGLAQSMSFKPAVSPELLKFSLQDLRSNDQAFPAVAAVLIGDARSMLNAARSSHVGG